MLSRRRRGRGFTRSHINIVLLLGRIIEHFILHDFILSIIWRS
jgi:hypothetical protein